MACIQLTLLNITLWSDPHTESVGSQRPPPVTSSFINLILILLGMQIREWSHTPVSRIKTVQTSLKLDTWHTGMVGNMFFILPAYSITSILLSGYMYHGVSASKLIIYWPQAPDQWEASASALDQSEWSWIWSSGLIWITGSQAARAGGALGRRQTNSGHWPRSGKHESLWVKSGNSFTIYVLVSWFLVWSMHHASV